MAIRYTENELLCADGGRVVLESDTGERQTFGQEMRSWCQRDFSGTWEVLEDCSKIYAIFEPLTGSDST